MNTSVRQETSKENQSCEHCGRTFIRESTLLKHLCEQKRRWLDKDRLSNRIGYNSWKNYYNTHHPNKKNTTYKDFINSSYYGAFLKFGIYCSDINAINPGAYAEYLLKQRTPIDNWASDKSYTGYLIDYLKTEDSLDAVTRTLDALIKLSKDENIQLCDVFKFVNSNKLCYLITMGKLSPWVLYQSSTGVEFLSKLNQNQTNLVFEYIDPEKWNIKFKRENEKVIYIKEILNKIPL